MRIIKRRINELAASELKIGFAGENEHTRVVLDCADEFAQYPHSVPAVTVQPAAGLAYPAIVRRDGDTVIWDVTDSDLAAAGHGEIQVTFTENGVICKSCIGRILVRRSIEPTGEAPDPVEDWLVEANTALNAIPQTIDDALEAAKESGEFDGADGYSPSASVSKSGSTATITITDRNGTTTATISDGQKGDPGNPGDPGAPGVSPSVSVDMITGGHEVTITDASGDHSFNVMDGTKGDPGTPGDPTELIDDTSTTATDKVWSASKTAGEVSDLKSAFSNLNKNAYNELTSGLTQNASTYFDFYMFAGKTYVFKNTGASGQIALATRYDRSGSDIETINSSLAHGASYEFTPQYDTSILRVFCNAANGSFSVYQKGTSERRLIKAEEDIIAIEHKNAAQDKIIEVSEVATGFIAIPSITATKQQYINTGINYNATTGFEAEFEMYSEFGQAAVMGNVLGSRISSGSKDLELNTFNTTATGLFRFGTSSAQKPGNIVRNKRIRCSWINNVYTVLDVDANTVLHSSTCTNANAEDNGYPIFLFALNNGGTATGLANMKLYAAKLYSGSTVIANFVPVYNNSTGKTGLYDTVRNAFYGDANGGDFNSDYGLALQVKLNTEDIEELKNGTAQAGTVYETELLDTIESYQTVLAASGIPMLTIPVFTDLHHDTKYTNDPTQDMMANIHALINYLHCDGLWNLGDAIDGQNQTKFQAETALSEVINKMYAITDRSHNLEGNHDSNIQSTWSQYGGIEGAKLTLPELYDSLNKGSTDEVHDFTTRLTNYYVDFDEYDIRVVCLGVDYVSFTIDTKTWLENVALNTNKKVVVLAHCPTRPEWGYNNDVQNGVAYIETPLKTFVNNGGKVLVYIHGHTHGDKISTASDLPFAEVSIGCAKYEKMNSGTEGATYQDRNANNATKILFDLVCVDQTSKKVHFIRYGAGSDRYISYT